MRLSSFDVAPWEKRVGRSHVRLEAKRVERAFVFIKFKLISTRWRNTFWPRGVRVRDGLSRQQKKGVTRGLYVVIKDTYMGDGVTNTRPPGRLSPDGSCLIAHRTSRKVPTGCTTYDDNPPQFKLTSTSRVNSLANLIIPNAVLLHPRRDCAARGS